jgi:hypothetical protein
MNILHLFILIKINYLKLYSFRVDGPGIDNVDSNSFKSLIVSKLKAIKLLT